MPTIDIKRKHKKSLKEARASIDRVAAAITERFDVTHEWKGDSLDFHRSGVKGVIALTKDTVQVRAELSFFLFAIASAVEKEIEKHLELEFG